MASKVTPQMCKYCFDVIINKIKKINPPTPPFDPNLEWYNLHIFYFILVEECLSLGKLKKC